ncbi:MAG TPA: mycofactocin-coupled SDR family oxidoreductase [Acidimicrobiales bacterium]|jgi:SDR family mycofactocin-dependent oxidoreductase
MTGTAVVTGGARGIGAATVRRLAADGWSVVVIDRGSDDPRLPYAMGTAEQLHAVTDALGDQVIAVVGDATSLAVMTEAIDTAERRFGGVDAIIAAAGVIAGGVPQWEMPEREQQALLDINLGGVLVAARAGIPALLRRPVPRHGRFLAVASAAAARGMPMLAVYSAAKAGVVGLVRGLAAELRGTGVTANSVSPGSTDTDILVESARLYHLESAQSFSDQQVLERLLDPEEVAAALAWLAGPESSAMTGANVAVDGGLTL